MNLEPERRAQVDDEGRLVLPPEVAAHYGLKPGAQLQIDEGANGLHLRQPVTRLAKVYVEPTNICNLECRTCIRNVWDEPPGRMSSATFARVVEGLRAFSPTPSVFFGGFGLSETNEEDCFGNPFPTCGGCLWAQGVIQCP